MDQIFSHLLKFTLLVILLGLTTASTNKIDFAHCEKAVKRWASSAANQETEADAHTLRDLLFFLHVPRTGGRTYFHCFLKKLYSNSQECPRSYDKLRFDPRKPKCRLLVTHDDYSMMSKLPKERTSVVTILRNPVDRVFSTYEFSIEVAARFLVHPNLTSATQMTKRLRAKTKGVSTLDIWPWKYLVPWMREDLFARRDVRRENGPNVVEGHDPYNMEGTVMPLQDYINDPIARDIVHNGATFQVAGLTNNSYYDVAHEVRHCIMHYKELGHYALEVAKRRLDNMLYVGLTEDHRESATMFGNVVGAQVISQLKSADPGTATDSAEETSDRTTVTDSELDGGLSENTTSEQKKTVSTPGDVEASDGNMTVNKLMKAYESCISTLRRTQGKRRIASLKHVVPANFTKEARSHVSAAVLEEIKSLNNLDFELYEYAREIFAKQHDITNQNLRTDSFGGILSSRSHSTDPWNLVLMGAPLLLLALFIFAFVKARRTMKIKI